MGLLFKICIRCPIPILRYLLIEIIFSVIYYTFKISMHIKNFIIYGCCFKLHKFSALFVQRMYLAYTRNSRFTSTSTLPAIHFMRHSLVEALLLAPRALAYRIAFVYVRQLAIFLRNAIQEQSKVYEYFVRVLTQNLSRTYCISSSSYSCCISPQLCTMYEYRRRDNW